MWVKSFQWCGCYRPNLETRSFAMGSRCWVPEALTKIGMHTASCDSLVGCLGLSWQLSSFRIINDIKQCDGFGHVNGGPDGVQRLTEWNYVDSECSEHSNVLVLLCFPWFSTAARQCATLTAPLGERYSRSGDSCPPCHFLA